MRRLRDATLNWSTEHLVLADIQRFARRRLAEAGAPGVFPGYFMDLQSKVVDAFLQATVSGFEYPRSDLAPAVRFVGPILVPPGRCLRPTRLVGRAGTGAAGGPRHAGHTRQRGPRPAAAGDGRALAHDDVLVVATTGGPDPEPLRRQLPANVRLERFVPHHLFLPHVDVMVTNGGYGGVQQALADGVPLVVAGDSEDKPEVAARVQWSGAGINLHTGRPSPGHGARAVRRGAGKGRSFRRRARNLQAEIVGSDPLGAMSGRAGRALCAPTRPGPDRLTRTAPGARWPSDARIPGGGPAKQGRLQSTTCGPSHRSVVCAGRG